MTEIFYWPAAELAKAIRTKQISSTEAVTAHLGRIARVNPPLNAVVQLAAEAALDEARRADQAIAQGEPLGPLHGVPITLKDGWDTAGIVTTGGTMGRKSFVPAEDATVVARIKRAGAIIMGKTNLPELSLTNETTNAIFGRTRNPYDLTRSPGGSGGGQAAIIAAGGSPLDIGCDAGGSVRNPAHFCGIAGIRGTTGLIPMTGYFPWPSGVRAQLTSAGPLARTVADLILALPLLMGPDWRDPMIVPVAFQDPARIDLKTLRVAFYTDNGIISPTQETAEAVRKAARALESAGATVEEALPPGIGQTSDLFSRLMSADGGAEVQAGLAEAGTEEAGPWLKRRSASFAGGVISSPDYSRLLARLDGFRRSMYSIFAKYQLILCPVNAGPAYLHGTTMDGDNVYRFSYAQSYNLTGWPGAVVRGGTSPEGLPIGVQIVARPWGESEALAAAALLESELGGWQPPEGLET